MAETQPNQPKPGLAERGSDFLGKVHLGIGGVALLASAVVAPVLVVPLEAVGAFELVHGGALEIVHGGLKKHRTNKNS